MRYSHRTAGRVDHVTHEQLDPAAAGERDLARDVGGEPARDSGVPAQMLRLRLR